MNRAGGVRRTLRLGFLSPFLDDLVAPVIREFQQRHANSKVSLFDLPPRAQLDRLRQHELDLGILANLEDRERAMFDVRKLSKCEFIAVLPEAHRLAHRKAVKLKELETDDWVSLSNAFFPKRREFLIETCETAGFVPRIVAEMDSLPMMLAEIGTGGGVGSCFKTAAPWLRPDSAFLAEDPLGAFAGSDKTCRPEP